MGRPRKSASEHRINGTYRSDRYALQEKSENVLSAIESVPLKVPKSITDKTVRKVYKQHITMLRTIHMEQAADGPELEYAYLCLQKARELQDTFSSQSPLSDEFDSLQKKFTRLYKEYNTIVQRYFVSPQSRLRLTLDALSAEEKKNNIENQSAAARLLARKES